MIEQCDNCRFFGERYKPDGKRADCRIRSTPGEFPTRNSTDWCGEYEPTKETTDNDGKWIKWNGGDCPVHPNDRVFIRFRNGESEKPGQRAGIYTWSHSFGDEIKDPYDIVAYRLET